MKDIKMSRFEVFKDGIAIGYTRFPPLKLFFGTNSSEKMEKFSDENDPIIKNKQKIFEETFEHIVRVCADASTNEKILKNCLVYEDENILSSI
ncbi:hypothetical protein [uncultured Microscilla sp.]|uniref:hypothetical protein n=1 Tax=uncultured Microscilla sp. TaxID=432653 RepID=UPI0026238C87|nr:hypothetical protein [uncultured Microscilla sp.]